MALLAADRAEAVRAAIMSVNAEFDSRVAIVEPEEVSADGDEAIRMQVSLTAGEGGE